MQTQIHTHTHIYIDNIKSKLAAIGHLTSLMLYVLCNVPTINNKKKFNILNNTLTIYIFNVFCWSGSCSVSGVVLLKCGSTLGFKQSEKNHSFWLQEMCQMKTA